MGDSFSRTVSCRNGKRDGGALYRGIPRFNRGSGTRTVQAGLVKMIMTQLTAAIRQRPARRLFDANTLRLGSKAAEYTPILEL